MLTLFFALQISDIVVGQEDVSAKEALLRWAQKTTHRYPGVKVDNFTSSWRDGLAFNAIIHRNRPDLVEWKKLDRRQVRERIDLAFHVMEKEYGVTRLLDPEGKTFLDNHSSHTVLENSCQLHMGVSEVGGQRRVSYVCDW